MKQLICIVCPRGCHLSVDEEHDFAVTGNSCPRGAQYGRTEISNPVRVLTSTVRISGAAYRRCPVRTSTAIPKGKLFELMQLLNTVDVASPIKRGDVIISNVLETGADLIATKSM